MQRNRFFHLAVFYFCSWCYWNYSGLVCEQLTVSSLTSLVIVPSTCLRLASSSKGQGIPWEPGQRFRLPHPPICLWLPAYGTHESTVLQNRGQRMLPVMLSANISALLAVPSLLLARKSSHRHKVIGCGCANKTWFTKIGGGWFGPWARVSNPCSGLPGQKETRVLERTLDEAPGWTLDGPESPFLHPYNLLLALKSLTSKNECQYILKTWLRASPHAKPITLWCALLTDSLDVKHMGKAQASKTFVGWEKG